MFKRNRNRYSISAYEVGLLQSIVKDVSTELGLVNQWVESQDIGTTYFLTSVQKAVEEVKKLVADNSDQPRRPYKPRRRKTSVSASVGSDA